METTASTYTPRLEEKIDAIMETISFELDPTITVAYDSVAPHSTVYLLTTQGMYCLVDSQNPLYPVRAYYTPMGEPIKL